MNLDRWLDRIYAETDFGRSVAISVSGIIGLASYLIFDDWVIALFTLIITFPLARLIASRLYDSKKLTEEELASERKLDKLFENLTDDEKKVIRAFISNGGCVLTWSQVNNRAIPSSGIESLMRRGHLYTGVTADGMTETFELSLEVMDHGRKKLS